MQDLQKPLQVADHGHQDSTQDTVENGAERCRGNRRVPLSLLRRLGPFHQIVNQAESTRHRPGEQQGDSQIERDVGRHTRQFGEHGHHQIAEIVVADGKAGEPGVMGGKGLAAQDGIEEAKLHRLLGACYLGVVGPVEGPQAEGQSEERFAGDDDPSPFS